MTTRFGRCGRLDRRDVLALMGGATALAVPGLRPAFAQDMVGVVGTWGGDYLNLLEQNIVKPLLTPEGVEIQWDVANAPPRKNKLLAERRLPTGTLDIACFSDIDMYEMSLTGVLATLDDAKFPNAQNLIPALKKDYAAPHIYSGLVIVYNPEHAEPKSWSDLWDSRYDGKVGFADGLYSRTSPRRPLRPAAAAPTSSPASRSFWNSRKRARKSIRRTRRSRRPSRTRRSGWCRCGGRAASSGRRRESR